MVKSKNMNAKKVSTFLLLLIIAVILGVVIWGSKSKKSDFTPSSQSVEANQSGVPIFFYGNTCPHCADVEKWMKENKIEEKIEIVKKEVYDNRANSLELVKTAESCGIDTKSIGVPFLYTPEGKCLVGTPDIIAYLSDKTGLSGDPNASDSGEKIEQ